MANPATSPEPTQHEMLAHCNTVSQAGQDFWVYAEAFNEKTNGFFLDVGAHDGVHLSNTFILEKRYGWSGLCIEGNPETFQQLQENRTCQCIKLCVDRAPGVVDFALRGTSSGIIGADVDNTTTTGVRMVSVDALPLVEILRQANAPEVIDYLSIDIEGAEERALLEFPFGDYTFNAITIERPSDPLRAVLQQHGYIPVKEIPYLDCFYVHRSFLRAYQTNLLAFAEKRFLIKRWV